MVVNAGLVEGVPGQLSHEPRGYVRSDNIVYESLIVCKQRDLVGRRVGDGVDLIGVVQAGCQLQQVDVSYVDHLVYNAGSLNNYMQTFQVFIVCDEGPTQEVEESAMLCQYRSRRHQALALSIIQS